jgi:uncharacterized membrane protein (UPF0127 family)
MGRALAAILGAALAVPLLAEPATPSWAVAILPGGGEFTLEVAADPESQARGYMFREKVGPREGLLFTFDETGRHSIWMKNCKVALDVLWLDPGYRVVHIEHGLPPCPDEGECLGTAPLLPSRYVIELAAGSAKAQGVRVGDGIVILHSTGDR